MPRATEDFRTLYCDPGEDFGWALGVDLTLAACGTEKMWRMCDNVWDLLDDPSNPSNPLNNPAFYRDELSEAEAAHYVTLPLGRIVCEDFRIYPNKAKELSYDRVRTARAIGSLTQACRRHGIPLYLQGADIKDAAHAAGAYEYYYRPLTENRHQNDAIQHFVFFTNVELLGLDLQIKNGMPKVPENHEDEPNRYPVAHHPV